MKAAAQRRRSNNFSSPYTHESQKKLVIYGIVMTLLLLSGSFYTIIMLLLENIIFAYEFYVGLNFMNNLVSGATPYLMILLSTVIRKRLIDRLPICGTKISPQQTVPPS